MEPVDDDHGEYFLDVVHEPCEHAKEKGGNEEERRVDLDLVDQRSRSLVFPDDIEVRFEAAECKNKGDEKTASTDKPEFLYGDMFRIFDEIHDLLGRPVQIEHVDDDGEVIRDEVTEPDCKRDGSEHDEERNDCHEGRIGQGCGTRHSVIVQERFPGDNHDFYERRRTGCDIIEQPLPREIFPPLRHIAINIVKGRGYVIQITKKMP